MKTFNCAEAARETGFGYDQIRHLINYGQVKPIIRGRNTIVLSPVNLLEIKAILGKRENAMLGNSVERKTNVETR